MHSGYERVHSGDNAAILNVPIELESRTRRLLYLHCLAVTAAKQCVELSPRHSPLHGDKAFAEVQAYGFCCCYSQSTHLELLRTDNMVAKSI